MDVYYLKGRIEGTGGVSTARSGDESETQLRAALEVGCCHV